MEVKIEDSFELLTQGEWNDYLSTQIFEEMKIEDAEVGASENILANISHPRLHEMIQEHNNKIGSLLITYALCRHYYDKGIPDEPWYISPGKNGESVQYMPNFQEEHWMRQYWFNFFSDTYYLKISAIWDSVIEILNHYYGFDFSADLRLRTNVLNRLKDKKPELHSIFKEIQNNDLYIAAQKYRTAAAHGTSAGSVTNTVKVEKDVLVDIPDKDADGNLILDENGVVKMKKVKAKCKISGTVGDYTNVATIMENMESYAIYTGEQIQKIIEAIREE